MEPTIKRIRMSQPYVVHPVTKQIYASYQVMVTWPDGKRETFDSDEHAKAKIEGRSVNQSAVEAEAPAGYLDALSRTRVIPPPPPPVEKTADEFDVILVSYDNKIAAIKAVRVITGLGLRESKALVDSVPSVVREVVTKDEADNVVSMLKAAGATVEIK